MLLAVSLENPRAVANLDAGSGVAESRDDKLIVRSQTSENLFFDFDTELEHLKILDSELVTELNILAFVQMRE